MTTTTENKTAKNNMLIAEFMGLNNLNHTTTSVFDEPNLKYHRKTTYERDGLCRWCHNNVSHGHNIKCYVLDESTLKYNSSWDWLMPVVEKINIIDDFKYTVIIRSMDIEIYNNITGKILFESECKWQPDELINSLYEAVVEFIKWHNSKK